VKWTILLLQTLDRTSLDGVNEDGNLPYGRALQRERQVKTVRRSLTEDAAKSLVHAFVTSRIDYCNLVIYTVRVQLISSHYRTCWTQRVDWYCTNGSTTTSPATSEIDCTGCPFSSAWSTRSVCWFLQCDAMHSAAIAGICGVCPSVCPSVRLSRSWVAPKRIKISSKLFTIVVAKPF